MPKIQHRSFELAGENPRNSITLPLFSSPANDDKFEFGYCALVMIYDELGWFTFGSLIRRFEERGRTETRRYGDTCRLEIGSIAGVMSLCLAPPFDPAEL